MALKALMSFLRGDAKALPQHLPVSLLRSCTISGRSPGAIGSGRPGSPEPLPSTWACERFAGPDFTFILVTPAAAPVTSLYL